MENLCTSCLCADRKLYFLSETGFEHLYTQIVNEIAVYNISELCVRICWECKALLRKVGNFKEQVKTCYMQLLQYVQRNTVKQLTNFSRLQNHKNCTISYPQIKEDIEEYSFADDGIPYVDDITPFVDGNTPFVDVTPYVGSIDNCDLKTEETQDETETFDNDSNMDEIMQSDSGMSGVKTKNKNKIANPVSKVRKDKYHIRVVRKKRKTKYPCSCCGKIFLWKSKLEHHMNVHKLKNNEYMKNSNLQNENETYNPEVTVKEELDENTPYVDVGTPYLDVGTPYVNNSTPYVDVGTPYVNNTTPYVNVGTLCAVDANETEAVVNDTIMDKIKKKNSGKKRDKAKANDKITNAVPKLMEEVLSDKPVCAECGKTFSSKKTYRYHFSVLHKGQNNYPCPRCGKIYQWKSNLGRHMRTHKARDAGELYCELCDRKFASVATYRQHLKLSKKHVSENEYSFVCNDCGKKFPTKTRLRDHIDWEHLKKIKFKCQLCNKPLKCHTSLYIHMQHVHNTKDTRDNLCHVCGKSFQSAAKLKYHIIAMHTSETPYQCTQCNATFNWNSSLYRHVREVHYKIKVQQKKSKKQQKSEILPSLLPVLPQI